MGCGDRTTTLFSTTVITSTVTVHPVRSPTPYHWLLLTRVIDATRLMKKLRRFEAVVNWCLLAGPIYSSVLALSADLRIHYIFIPHTLYMIAGPGSVQGFD